VPAEGDGDRLAQDFAGQPGDDRRHGGRNGQFLTTRKSLLAERICDSDSLPFCYWNQLSSATAAAV
jgi:hypothetical protein